MNKVTIGPIVRGKTTSVTTTISNLGTAPTYDRWSVQLWLLNSAGKKVYAKALWVDLRKILPGVEGDDIEDGRPDDAAQGDLHGDHRRRGPAALLPEHDLSNYTHRADGSYTLGPVVAG